MSKIICALLLSSLSFNVLANPYDQLGSALNDMIDALAKKKTGNSDNNQVNYSNTGSFTYGSDGSSYYNTEDRSYGNNGNNYYQMNENSGYDSNGSTYQRVGDYIYINNPDGTRTVCYVSDVGTQCR
ncbi:hypothetical protein ACLD0Q_15810 [Acinetobacter baumannii]|uniref:hypothetical protein n=1 Tax=Acinetobacter junii TaxID=40215 RepID=UPI0039706EE4